MELSEPYSEEQQEIDCAYLDDKIWELQARYGGNYHPAEARAYAFQKEQNKPTRTNATLFFPGFQFEMTRRGEFLHYFVCSNPIFGVEFGRVELFYSGTDKEKAIFVLEALLEGRDWTGKNSAPVVS